MRRRVDPPLLLRRLERPAHPGHHRRAACSAGWAPRGSRARSAPRRPARPRPGSTARWPGVAFAGLRARAADRPLGRQPLGLRHPPRAVHPGGAEAGARSWWSIDPRRTPLAKQADLHLAPRPGTDLPLALAAIRWFFENGRADLAFLAEHATGGEELRRRAQPWTFERAAEVAGIAGRRDRGASSTSTPSPRRRVIRTGWGMERNRNGGSAVAAALALPAVAGKFGVRGGGYTMSNSRRRGGPRRRRRRWRSRRPPTRTINMNLLGETLLERADPPVQRPVRLQLQPAGDHAEPGEVRARPRARGPVHRRLRPGVDRHRPAGPTWCCRRPTSWSTRTWCAATARTLLQQHAAGGRAGGRGALEPRGLRRAARSGSGSPGRAIRRRPTSSRAALLAPPRSGCAPSWSATASRAPRLRHGARPVRRRLPAHAGPQDPSRPRGARPRGARAASTASRTTRRRRPSRWP